MEHTLTQLEDERQRLMDAVASIDMSDPQAEAKIAYLEGCLADVDDEIQEILVTC